MPITYFFKKVNFYLPAYILLNLFVGVESSLHFYLIPCISISVVTNSVMY